MDTKKFIGELKKLSNKIDSMARCEFKFLLVLGDDLNVKIERSEENLGRYSRRFPYKKMSYDITAYISMPSGLYTIFQSTSKPIIMNGDEIIFTPEEKYPNLEDCFIWQLKYLNLIILVVKNLILHGVDPKNKSYNDMCRKIFGVNFVRPQLLTAHATKVDKIIKTYGREGLTQYMREWINYRPFYIDAKGYSDEFDFLGGIDFLLFNKYVNDLRVKQGYSKVFYNHGWKSEQFDSFTAWRTALGEEWDLSLVKDIVKYIHKKLKDTMLRPEIQDAPMGTPINLRLGITSLGVVLDFIHIYDVHPLAAHEPSAFVHDLGVLIAKAKMKNAEENDVELPKLSSKIPVLCFKTIKEGKKIGAENHWCISVIDRYWTSFLNKSHMLYMVPYKERLILVYQTKDGVVAEAKYPFNESLSAPVMNVVKKIAKDVKFV